MNKNRIYLLVLGLLMSGVACGVPAIAAQAGVEPPVISAVYATGVEFIENCAFYNLTFNVEYSGASNIRYCVSQRDGGMVCYTVDEPEIARCSVDRLISEWWTEIDITVTNDGGKATYNFAVPPQSPDAEPEVSITCEQLAGSHTSNAGLAYSFAGKIPAGATDVKWSYCLLAYNNRMESCKQQLGGDRFDVPAMESIDDVSQWICDDDNRLSGEVLLTCKSADGLTMGSVYPLAIELKPVITDVKDMTKTFSADGLTYDLSFTVDFAGSDAVIYEVRQNSTSFQPLHETVYAEGSALCRADRLGCEYDTEIELSVENSYGTASRLIHLGPQDPDDPSGVADALADGIGRVEVYSAAGLRILAGDIRDGLRHLPSGVYIVRTVDSTGNVSVNRYLKR